MRRAHARARFRGSEFPFAAKAVEAKYQTERAELERRWEEDESDRLRREERWRHEVETAMNERDELVDAALAEKPVVRLFFIFVCMGN